MLGTVHVAFGASAGDRRHRRGARAPRRARHRRDADDRRHAACWTPAASLLCHVTTLFAVPNVSEGRDPLVLAAIGDAFARRGRARPRRPRRPRPPPRGVHARRRARASWPTRSCAARARPSRGSTCAAHARHPPARRRARRGARSSTSTTRGAAPPAPRRSCSPTRLGDELGLPVFLYGVLAAGRTRAELRRGGPVSWRGAGRAASCARLRPARARTRPPAPTLVAARPPLIAFNLELRRRRRRATRGGSPRRSARAAPDGLPGRARDRPAARGARRRRPGLDATSRTTSRRRWPRVRRGGRARTRRSRERRARRPARPRRRSPACPTDRRRCATARTLEDAARAAYARRMAQTKRTAHDQAPRQRRRA